MESCSLQLSTRLEGPRKCYYRNRDKNNNDSEPTKLEVKEKSKIYHRKENVDGNLPTESKDLTKIGTDIEDPSQRNKSTNSEINIRETEHNIPRWVNIFRFR